MMAATKILLTLGVAGIIGTSVLSPSIETEAPRVNDEQRPLALVNYDYFQELVAEVKDHRAERLVGLGEFLTKSTEKNTIILDTRSKEMYDRKHIKGAIHLNFADFNIWSLEDITRQYGGKDAQILIYCNNNFWNKPKNVIQPTEIRLGEIMDPAFASKSVTPSFDFVLPDSVQLVDSTGAKPEPEAKANDLAKVQSLALNIPTYINLYGYGYKNVYELEDMVDVNDLAVTFEGTDVK